MPKGLRIGLIAAGAIVLGSAMARGLPHHAAAPAPAPAPSSGGGGVSIVGLIVFALALLIFGLAALSQFHKRKLIQLKREQAKLDRFVNVRRADLGDLYRCPDCHCLIMVADIDDHQEVSACAQYKRWLEDNDAAETELEPPAYAAERVSQSATIAPEHSVTTGDLDTFNTPRGELE